jgi:hypothetical protein
MQLNRLTKFASLFLTATVLSVGTISGARAEAPALADRRNWRKSPSSSRAASRISMKFRAFIN